MSVSKSFVFATELPQYQREAIEWLKGYRDTRTLRDVLTRCRFSAEEIAAYRVKWAAWLQPKKITEKKLTSGIH